MILTQITKTILQLVSDLAPYFVKKSGDTMTGTLTTTTHGGSWISQTTADVPIEFTPSAVTDGSRYDAFMRGTFTDDSTWALGGIYKKLYLTYFNAGRTENGTDGEVWFDPANSEIGSSSLSLRGPITYRGTKATTDMITFKDNTDDAYGNGIGIGGGGVTAIGGGESASVVLGQYTGGSETMVVANDGDVEVWSNCQSGASSAKKFYFKAGGGIYIPGGRAFDSGDDEGIVIGWAGNWCGLILGSNSGRRSCFYMSGGASGTDKPRWRYNNGSSNYDIYHPARGGTIALVPAVLYNNGTGTNGTVGLSASAASYNHMRIFFKKNGDSQAKSSVDVFSPNGTRFGGVLANSYNGSHGQFLGRSYTISGTSISAYNGSEYFWNTENNAGGKSGSTYYIYRVEAWND